MVKYYKIIFVFILLLSGKDLIAEDRYLSWIEPKSQNRSKINLKTQELLVEKVSIGWLKEGKITLDTSILVQLPREVKSNYFFFDNGEKIRFTIDGTGLVFDYYVRKKELIRVDNTYHSGYNYFSTKFLRKGGYPMMTYSYFGPKRFRVFSIFLISGPTDLRIATSTKDIETFIPVAQGPRAKALIIKTCFLIQIRATINLCYRKVVILL
jgi:hypothetical protein